MIKFSDNKIVFFAVAVWLCIIVVLSNFADFKQELMISILPNRLISLANENRVLAKLPLLKENSKLTKAAQMKVDDMIKNNYFAHVSPAGVTPWYFFKKSGYDYFYAGENLAVSFAESEEVNKAWMNSLKHKTNILNGKYTEIGIAIGKGIYKGREATFVVQMFGRTFKDPAALRLSMERQLLHRFE